MFKLRKYFIKQTWSRNGLPVAGSRRYSVRISPRGMPDPVVVLPGPVSGPRRPETPELPELPELPKLSKIPTLILE